ncbi:Troponin C, isoform 2 [Armadillidium nasatum]|uniref:Troponin C, isoform 2 n=1 Tax=Armadillidium nasatum TaxID=96803 RepID=A0A5N5SPD0_9CRUS|nr:Troponin C, isoform 2 [Armadillidium nasatum]
MMGQTVNRQILAQIIEEVDVDGSGELEFNEFVMLATKFMNEEDEEEMKKELKEAFRLYDRNKYIILLQPYERRRVLQAYFLILYACRNTLRASPPHIIFQAKYRKIRHQPLSHIWFHRVVLSTCETYSSEQENILYLPTPKTGAVPEVRKDFYNVCISYKDVDHSNGPN